MICKFDVVYCCVDWGDCIEIVDWKIGWVLCML